MKIRTDFVTNSSSSNFCLEITVTDKNGKKYYLQDNPGEDYDDGGAAYFTNDLEKILYNYSNPKLFDILSQDYKVKVDQNEKAIAIIEELHVGEKVKLKFRKTFNYGEGAIISVGTKKGVLGTICIEKYGKIVVDTMKYSKYVLEGIVTYIKPLSERSKSAKLPLLNIRIVASEKEETEENKNKILVYDTISELCKFLTSSVSDDGSRSHRQNMKEEKENFTKVINEKIENISDIKFIEVQRNYYAWGEFSDLIPFNDVELCRLAKKVVETTGSEHIKALGEMAEYISKPDCNRQGSFFGRGYSDFRYNFYDITSKELEIIANILCKGISLDALDETEYNECDEEIIEFFIENAELLATNLCNGRGPEDVSGVEYNKIDMETGKFEKYAIFNLI